MKNLAPDLRRLLIEGWTSDDPDRAVRLHPDVVERLATDAAYALLGLLGNIGALAMDELEEVDQRIAKDRKRPQTH